jgi:hypothetical protein
MPRAGFEPTIPVTAAKIYALDGTGCNLFQFIVTFEIMNKLDI